MTQAGALWLLALVLVCAPAVFGGTVLGVSMAWLPALGLDLGFRMDGLAWQFALLITGIGALVVLYASWYLEAKDLAGRFFTFLLLFMGAMLGVVLADNLILLVLFWELTSLSSFLLSGYWHHRQDARQGARMALTITGGGGLCLLAGVLLLQVAKGQAWPAQRGGLLGGADYRTWLACGLLVAAAAGAGSWAPGSPFLTSTYDYPWLPGVGGVPLASASVFDLGVMVVVGATLVMQMAMGRFSSGPRSSDLYWGAEPPAATGKS